MAAIVDVGAQPTSELSAAAKRARQLAEKIIVSEFKGYVRGQGAGPTETQLRVFAKLAAVELALEHHPSSALPLAQFLNSAATAPLADRGAV